MSSRVLAVLWLLVGFAMIAVPAWVGWRSWRTLLNGHPITSGVALASLLLGFLAVAWALGTLILANRPDPHDRVPPPVRTAEQLRRRAIGRIIVAVPALLICLVMVGILAWVRPLAATDRALSAMPVVETGTIRVADKLTWYELVPNKRDKFGDVIKPTIGLVFVPGARVDARAYASLLKPLAEAGYLVAVLKEPFGVALTAPLHATTVIEAHQSIKYWAVGGHSLGGVAAANYADEHPQEINGLIMVASYPDGKLARSDLKVASIFGSQDELTTPAEVQQSKENLPPKTTYVEVKGAAHDTFGDYAPQPGAGTEAVDHAAAQQQTAKAMIGLLASLPPPKKK